MDPERLRALLAVLREAGVRRAKVPSADGLAHFEVEFGPPPEPEATPAAPTSAVLIDKRTGQPADLDEGAPDLASDPGDGIRAANFPPKT